MKTCGCCRRYAQADVVPDFATPIRKKFGSVNHCLRVQLGGTTDGSSVADGREASSGLAEPAGGWRRGLRACPLLQILDGCEQLDDPDRLAQGFAAILGGQGSGVTFRSRQNDDRNPS